MNFRFYIFLLAIGVFQAESIAQPAANWQVSRTEYNQPDLQGVWSTRFNTMLERPAGLPLILSPEQAAGVAQAIAAGAPDNTDPDVDYFGPPVLAMVKGEYRSSVIVHPENGVLPYNELGTVMSDYAYFKPDFDFDHPEQRPGVERCIEGWGSPPMRAFSYQLFHAIVQTRDKIAIISEEQVARSVIENPTVLVCTFY